MVQKTKKILLNCFYFIFSIVMLYLINIAIFRGSQYFMPIEAKYTILSTLLLAILLFFLLFIFDRFKLSKKVLIGIIVGSLFLILGLQLLFSIIFINYPTWDFGHVFEAAYSLSQGNNLLPEYFYLDFPNNIGSALILGGIFKLFSIVSDSKNFMIVIGILVNITVIQVSLVTSLILVSKIRNLKVAALLSIFLLGVTPLYAYAPIFYTDTLVMVFPLMAILLIYVYQISEWKYREIYLISAGIIFSIGIIVKTNVIVVMIAALLYLIFKYKIKQIIKTVVLVILPFFIITPIYEFQAQKYIPISYEEAGLPATHWIMMGLYGRGWFTPEEYNFSSSIYRKEGKEATEEANLTVIKDRLVNYGFDGLVSFWDDKISQTWNDGTYFAPEKLQRNLIYKLDAQKYVLGDSKDIYIYLSQASHVILLIGLFLFSITRFNKKLDINTLGLIAIFGVFLFLILWETRSRYLVFILPLMWIISIQGWSYLYDKSKKLVSRKTVNN